MNNEVTFGYAIAHARKQRRLTIKALLKGNPSLSHFSELLWNELEQDRHDPRNLAEGSLRAIEATLGISLAELQRLAAKHEEAFAEQNKFWSLLTIEAHAFRARRSID